MYMATFYDVKLIQFQNFTMSKPPMYRYSKQSYTKEVEEFIEEELEKRIPDFNMRSFIQGQYDFHNILRPNLGFKHKELAYWVSYNIQYFHFRA